MIPVSAQIGVMIYPLEVYVVDLVNGGVMFSIQRSVLPDISNMENHQVKLLIVRDYHDLICGMLECQMEV